MLYTLVMVTRYNETSNKVEVELRGGIGNQLFGYATAFSSAQRANLDLCVNISQLKDHGYQLHEMGIHVKNINEAEFVFKPKKFYVPRTSEKVGYRQEKKLLVEDESIVDGRVFEIKSSTYFRGYFQSWKYFDDYRAELLDTFLLNKELSDNAKIFEEQLKNQPWTAIHLRRGDYLDFPDTYEIPTTHYYLSAMKLVASNTTLGKVVVFSDDKVIAHKIFPTANLVIGPEDIPTPAENILLMRRASSIIGANSTFSWWGAYLADQDTGLKIFPRPWFLSKLKKESDILLPEWITLGS